MLRLAAAAALVTGLVAGAVVCPDHTRCPEKNTCCETHAGYSCCIYPFAVCCPDMKHCCPEGYRCNDERMLCEKAGPAWARPELPVPRAAHRGVIRCDGRFYCPADSSCCVTAAGQWGCCPYRLGECCKDGKHCCPYKWKCDCTSQQCSKGNTYMPAAPRTKTLIL
ncbi:progranulin-like [Denticeps clupeoides]|uniref:progranulin-like n=1 Tax=Denticeps clupeoides TaxID=299321 RepID=UPI0010A556E6|nr:progranulin-like [Denticeps clupeoides]